MVSKAPEQHMGTLSKVRADLAQLFAGEDVPPSHVVSDRQTKRSEKRRWTINGDFLSLRRNGVARYAREVTLQLDALFSEGHPLTRDLDLLLISSRVPDVPLKRIRNRVVPEYKYPRLPQFWVQMQLPFYVRGGLVSFCNLAPVLCKRHIVCIHDLHTKLMPESYGRLFRMAHYLILPLLGRRAARITTVSELAKEHLASYGVAPKQKIVVTYNGSDHAKRWDRTRSRLKIETNRPFVFCFGRPERYKNAELLVQLAPMLDQIGLDVWVAGDLPASAYETPAGMGRSNVHVLGRISDDDLAQALFNAVCFLFPSRIEGFGLPAVEAMAHGCPVVASTSPCLPEVCGDAALFADPDDVGAWLSAVAVLSKDAALRKQMVEKGFAQAERYSWRSIAELYLVLMAEIDGLSCVASNVGAASPSGRSAEKALETI